MVSVPPAGSTPKHWHAPLFLELALRRSSIHGVWLSFCSCASEYSFLFTALWFCTAGGGQCLVCQSCIQNQSHWASRWEPELPDAKAYWACVFFSVFAHRSFWFVFEVLNKLPTYRVSFVLRQVCCGSMNFCNDSSNSSKIKSKCFNYFFMGLV